MKYRPEIDGLRAVAVVPVILFHAGIAGFSGGYVGVDIFFVISGYLISSILIREIDANRFSLVDFYERRARRILPALFFVIIACLPFAWFWLAPGDLRSFGRSLVTTVTFSSNISFWLESGYFAKAAELKPLLHTWSLALEEQYYIFFPLCLMVIWRWGERVIVILCAIALFASLALSHWAADYKPSANFYLLPTRAWELLIGVMATFYLRYRLAPKSIISNQALSGLGLVMIACSFFAFDETTAFPSLYALFPTLGAFLIIISAVPTTWVQRLLSLKPMIGLGLVSYSAYLWHQPLLAFARHRAMGEPQKGILLLLCVLSVLLAYVSWRWVERPFRDKSLMGRRKVFSYSLAITLIIGLVGGVFMSTQGAMSRFSIEEQKILASFQKPASYVTKRFSEIKLVDFDEESERKILIIGDSFAEDLTNALYESPLISNVSVSGYRFENHCGVLYVEHSKIAQHLEPICQRVPNFYNSKALIERMEQADEVWVTSAWQSWNLPFLPETIMNLKRHNPNIIIFGRKSFGDIHEGQFMFDGRVRAWTIARPLSAEAIYVMDEMRRIVPDLATYVDVQRMLCAEETSCVNSDGSDIYSYDGGHLTPYGAKYMGSRLF